MDVPRTGIARRKRARRAAVTIACLAIAALVTLGFSRLEPAAPVVERTAVWIDVVRRGPMVRQVRGLGTLVPEEVRWIAAATEGRVERILVQPGSVVAAETVILELANPELELAALEAESRWRGAEAELTELRVRLESQRLDQEAAAARLRAEQLQAGMRADADDALASEGLVADITRRLSRLTAEELASRHAVEQRRLAIGDDAAGAQLEVQRTQVERCRALAELRHRQLLALAVRAGIAGVLQQVPLDAGQVVTPGTNLARVARPDRLKAVLRVAETQARDVIAGQPAAVDTRNGVVAGRVVRVDPAVKEGTVTVDVALEGALPRGARPDLTVEGTIELERLDDVLFVGRPALAEPGGTLRLFRLVEGTSDATRVDVRLGRTSVNTVEIVEGLAPGDRVVLSDTTAWDAHDTIRID